MPWRARVPVSSPFCWFSRGRSHIYIYIYIIDVLKCISVYGGALLCLVVGICDLRRTNVHERFSVERLKPLGTRWRR